MKASQTVPPTVHFNNQNNQISSFETCFCAITSPRMLAKVQNHLDYFQKTCASDYGARQETR